MIQFFVNKKEILLPKDYSVTVIEENPEITSNGEYTLDLTVSLLEPQNAIAFEHLDRLNKTVINKNAEGIMIIDNQSRFGKIIVIKNTDVEVTFQFIAGNSELNYNAKEDNRKIWELDFGTETTIDYARALDSIENPIWTKNFVCTTVKAGAIANDYTFHNVSNLGNDFTYINGVNNIIMQPYLLYYITKFADLLGYTIIENILLEDNRAKTMFIVNSIKSLKYSDALPDMTVTEFIKSIEEFFSVTFIVDSRNKTMSIIRTNSSVLSKKIVKIDTVLDSYERDLSQSPISSQYGFTKVEYDLKDCKQFKYQQLSDDVLNKCSLAVWPNYVSLYNYVSSSAVQDDFMIHRDIQTGDDFIYCLNNTQELFRVDMNSKLISLVNKFKASGTSDENVLMLKVVPAEMVKYRKTPSVFIWQANPDLRPRSFDTQIPVSSLDGYVEEYSGITSTIENGIKKIPRNTKIEVSLYMGSIVVLEYTNSKLQLGWTDLNGVYHPPIDTSLSYPCSYLDVYPEFGSDYVSELHAPSTLINLYYKPFAISHMRLFGDTGLVKEYQLGNVLDTSKEYNFELEDEPNVNIKNIFDINNIKYIPISLQREKSNDPSTVLAKCYAML